MKLKGLLFPSSLFFSKRSVELIGERLDQIRQSRSLAGLDQGLRRHARHEGQPVAARQFVRRDDDPDQIPEHARPLVACQVGGDAVGFSIGFGEIPPFLV